MYRYVNTYICISILYIGICFQLRHLAQALALPRSQRCCINMVCMPFHFRFQFLIHFLSFCCQMVLGLCPLVIPFCLIGSCSHYNIEAILLKPWTPKSHFLKNLHRVMPIKFNQYQFFHHQTSPTTSMQVTTSQTPS